MRNPDHQIPRLEQLLAKIEAAVERCKTSAREANEAASNARDALKELKTAHAETARNFALELKAALQAEHNELGASVNDVLSLMQTEIHGWMRTADSHFSARVADMESAMVQAQNQLLKEARHLHDVYMAARDGRLELSEQARLAIENVMKQNAERAIRIDAALRGEDGESKPAAGKSKRAAGGPRNARPVRDGGD